jgi:pimeloyl-ACP methyl ester carboxylesterase
MMKRPVMNPMFLDEDTSGPKGRGAGKRASVYWKWTLRAGRLVWRIVKVLFTDVLRRARREQIKDETGTPFSRFCRALLYRLMFVPTLLAVLVTILVVTATHPRPAPGVMDPTSQGVYYDPVDLLSLDDTKLEGWLVPVVSARRVISEKDTVLHKKHPAIVLVHDFGSTRQQVLPLITPLHEAGYVLLAINLRGHGPSANAGVTFGLNEAQDVRAAVELLRRRPFVDPDAIGVLGIGTGATAALLAAEQDPRIAALVLDHPLRQFQDALNDRIGPRQAWLSWVRPMCKWGFEIAYKVDADDVNLSHFSAVMRRRPVLMLDDAGETVSSIKPARTKQVVQFLRKNLVAKQKVTQLMQREAVGHIDRPDRKPIPLDGPGGAEPSWPPQQRAAELLERARNTGW